MKKRFFAQTSPQPPGRVRMEEEGEEVGEGLPARWASS